MDFNAAIQTWKNVLTQPGEQVFEEEKYSPRASLTVALIWIVIAAVIVAFFSIFRVAITSFLGGGGGPGMAQLLSQMDVPPEMVEQFAAQGQQGMLPAFASAFCGSLIFVPIGFLISSGIYWIVARLLGGTGSFESQTYLLATFTAPIMIVNGVITVIPILGGCIALLVSIYNLVLSYFALKVAHEFTPGKAIITLLTPIIILFIFVCCIAVGFASIIGAAAGGMN